MLDLFVRLSGITRVRYARTGAKQQDAIRAEVETRGTKTNHRAGGPSVPRHVRIKRAAGAAQPGRPCRAARLCVRCRRRRSSDSVALEQRVREKNPQLFADEARVRAAEKNRELAYRNRHPDFNLGVSPTQTEAA